MGVPVTDPQYRHPAPTPQIGPGPGLGTPAFSKAQEGGCPPVLTLDVCMVAERGRSGWWGVDLT